MKSGGRRLASCETVVTYTHHDSCVAAIFSVSGVATGTRFVKPSPASFICSSITIRVVAATMVRVKSRFLLVQLEAQQADRLLMTPQELRRVLRDHLTETHGIAANGMDLQGS